MYKIVKFGGILMNIRAFLLSFLLIMPSVGMVQPNIAKQFIAGLATSQAQTLVEGQSVKLLTLIAMRALGNMTDKQITIPGAGRMIELADKRQSIYSSLGLPTKLVSFLENTANSFVQLFVISTLVDAIRTHAFGRTAPKKVDWKNPLASAAIGSLFSLGFELAQKEDDTEKNNPTLKERSKAIPNAVCSLAALIFVRACVLEGSDKAFKLWAGK